MISEFSRSYLPLNHPLGFGVSDTLLFTVAALLVSLALAWAFLERPARRLAQRPLWCLALVAVLPIALRLALLRTHPVPTPETADDFSYLLLGDTLAHLRLANPVHPMHRFFEAMFILQEPAYGSMFPLGQGIALALGQVIFHNPWAGVALSAGALCAGIYWMLRAWVSPLWALTGGLLAVCEFGPLNQWMNSYWGGAVAASAGCLAFGALPRLKNAWRARDAALLGAGVGVHMLTRPFETVFLVVGVLLYFVPMMIRGDAWRRLERVAAIGVAAAAPAVVLTGLHDRAATGSWTTLPYALSRYQYGVPAAFTFQPNPAPHRALTREQAVDYQAQRLVHGEGVDTVRSYFSRLAERLRFYRFFLVSPLYLVLPVFLIALREFRFAWVLLTVAVFSMGTNIYPYFYPHYVAALTCMFVLISVVALERVSRWNKEIARIVVLLCGAQFVFWYGIHLSGSPELLEALGPYETWDYINYGDLSGRAAINARLAREPGKQLVFVSYWPRHLFDEWIHNGADVDSSRVVFAADLGREENDLLRKYYPDRTAWVLEPDARPPRVTRYPLLEPEAVPAAKEKAVAPAPRGHNRIDPATIETVR